MNEFMKIKKTMREKWTVLNFVKLGAKQIFVALLGLKLYYKKDNTYKIGERSFFFTSLRKNTYDRFF